VTALYLWDDERARRFAPFALTRPAGELRLGALLLRERWERAAGMAATGFVSAAHLADFEEAGAPGAADRELPAGALVVNARCAPALDARLVGERRTWRCEGRVAAVRLPRPVSPSALLESGAELCAVAGLPSDEPGTALRGRWVDAVWDLVRLLPTQLTEDIHTLGAAADGATPAGLTVMGDAPVFVERGARVEPHTLADTGAGPVLIRRGATVRAFTRLEGPVLVGEDSVVESGRVAATVIGPGCRVHGEVSTTVFLGHANKAHEGFLGHSVVGRWVNLGAGTTTSNLKNTYGPVALWTPDGYADTGMQFLGTFFGDHAKTGIGVCLNTGTVMGTGANVYGRALPPRCVPSFAWGQEEPYATYDLPRFLQAAERMMARRQVTLGERERRQLAAAHARAAGWPP
jgi:UDP-N-acetylglucosamine diphosphorylase/glucosamine-1-phosphate N-acetyltransferase